MHLGSGGTPWCRLDALLGGSLEDPGGLSVTLLLWCVVLVLLWVAAPDPVGPSWI